MIKITMRAKSFCLLTIFVTFLLLILGGVVHNTGSSLACPDWPLCYGQVFPEMKGGILIEHSHRLLASLVGFLTIIVVYLTSKLAKNDERYLFHKKVAWISLAMVIVQGILGGITVIYKLPTIVSTTHLALSMIYFSTLIYLHHKFSEVENESDYKLDDEYRSGWQTKIRHGVLLSMVFVYAQIVLGAFMRHSGAGASCGLGFSNSLLCYDTSLWKLTFWPVISQAQLHMTHRIFAIIVSLTVFYYMFKTFRFFSSLKSSKISKEIMSTAFLVVFFIIAQVILGILVVAYHIQVIPTTAHLAVGALCLASLWKLFLTLTTVEAFSYGKNLHSFLSDITELTKPRLASLVMVTVIVGMILAPGRINFFKGLLSFSLIFLVVMSAAAFNCYLEMGVDSLMERTRERCLPSGRMNSKVALGFSVILISFSIPMLYIYINAVTAILSLIAFLLYVVAYTPLKLKTPLALFLGAVPGALPPILGWTTVTGTIDLMSVTLFAIIFVWQLPHFLSIAYYYAEDYEKASIIVYPNLLNEFTTIVLIAILTILTCLVSLVPSYYGWTSNAYMWSAIVLGFAFTLLSFGGFLNREKSFVKVWARSYFFASIFYLPLLLGSMIFLS